MIALPETQEFPAVLDLEHPINARKELFPTPANTLMLEMKESGQINIPTIAPHVSFIQIRGDFQPFCRVRHIGNNQVVLEMSSLISETYQIVSPSNDRVFMNQSFENHPHSEYLLRSATNDNSSRNATTLTLTVSAEGNKLRSSKKHLFIQEGQLSGLGKGVIERKIRDVFSSALANRAQTIPTLMMTEGGMKINDFAQEYRQDKLRIDTLIGMTELIAKLRSNIFGAVQLGIVDRHTDGKRKHLLYPSTFLSQLLPNIPNVVKEIAGIDAKIAQVDARLKEKVLHNSRSILPIIAARKRLKEWKQLLHELVVKMGLEVAGWNYQQLIKAETDVLTTRPSGAKKEFSFAQRLSTLLDDDRGIKKVAFGLNSAAFLNKTTYLADLLSDELLNTSLTISALRILERIDDPYNSDIEKRVDLIEARKHIHSLKERAAQANQEVDQKKRDHTLAELDKLLIAVVIPIVNRILELFPHDESVQNSTLIDMLDNSVALCAGKSTISQIVYRFLNIESVSVSSDLNAEFIGNTHQLNAVNLFSRGRVLVTDANYDRDTARARTHGVYHFLSENEAFLPKNAHVYMYTLSRVPDSEHPVTNSCIVFSHESNVPRVWYASIPYPHHVVSLDKPNAVLDSGAYLRAISKVTEANTKLQLCARCLEVNPNNHLLNYNYALLLDSMAGDPIQVERYYRKALEVWQPELFSVAYGRFLSKTGRLAEAEHYYLLALLDAAGDEAALKEMLNLSIKMGQTDSAQFYSKVLENGSFVYMQEMYQLIARHYEQMGRPDVSRAFMAKLRQLFDHPKITILMTSADRELYGSPLFGLRAKLANTAAEMNRIISMAALKHERTEAVVEEGASYLIWNPNFIGASHSPELIEVINSYFHQLRAVSLQELSHKLVEKYILNPQFEHAINLNEEAVDRLFRIKRDQVATQPLTAMEKLLLPIVKQEAAE